MQTAFFKVWTRVSVSTYYERLHETYTNIKNDNLIPNFIMRTNQIAEKQIYFWEVILLKTPSKCILLYNDRDGRMLIVCDNSTEMNMSL